jgi:hypothetical protein
MAEKSDGKLVTVSVEIYARLLTAYPPAFRRQFGAEMKQLFLDQCRDAAENGNWALSALWTRVLFDLAKTSVAECFASFNESPWRRAAALALGVVSLYCLLCAAAQEEPSLPSSFEQTRMVNLIELGAVKNPDPRLAHMAQWLGDSSTRLQTEQLHRLLSPQGIVFVVDPPRPGRISNSRRAWITALAWAGESIFLLWVAGSLVLRNQTAAGRRTF